MQNSNNQGGANHGTSHHDEAWKDQIRMAFQESLHRIANEPQAPLYRINLAPPRVTKSYYERLRAEEQLLQQRKAILEKKKAKSESELLKRRTVSGIGFRKPANGPNVTATDEGSTPRPSSRYSNWPRQSTASSTKNGKKKKKSHHVVSSESELALQDEVNLDEDHGGQAEESAEEVLTYFDPKFVKPEYKPLLGKSRNIVVGPPKEILRKYFGYRDHDTIPEDLENDDSPKAFVLPKKLWKDYDDTTDVGPAPKAVPFSFLPKVEPTFKKEDEENQKKRPFTPDFEQVDRMKKEKETEPHIPRQPKNYAADYLARQPFQKHAMTGTNLLDGSPGTLEHWEMKPINVDPGGQIKRDTEGGSRFKVSDVTETPVKVAKKEEPLSDSKRPWYYDDWAENMDPAQLAKSPKFHGDSLDEEQMSKPKRLGKDKDGERRADPKTPRGKGKRRRDYYPSDTSPTSNGGSSSESTSVSGSSGSSESCTCYSSSGGSGSSSKESGKDTESPVRSKSKKGKSKKEIQKDKDGEKPTSAKGVKENPDKIPDWAPEQWKSPEGYKQWIYRSGPKINKQESPPATESKPDETKEWIEALDIVKKELLLGDINPDDIPADILNPQPSASDMSLAEENDPMERLPREEPVSDVSTRPSRRRYLDRPPTEQFQYYKSYPLYPTLSSERHFEWYKDVDRLKNPLAKKRYLRPGISKSANNINWDDPKEAARWYSYGYRRPNTKPKPKRPDYNTKDYVFDNARSVILMPPKKPKPRYVDDRKGTTHYLEPSGLIQKYVLSDEYGKIPEYLMSRNYELGRPVMPDLDKFYRPHRCKFLHGHIHCKICMRAHPIIRHRRVDWHCEMTPNDFDQALEYRRSRILRKKNARLNHQRHKDYYNSCLYHGEDDNCMNTCEDDYNNYYDDCGEYDYNNEELCSEDVFMDGDGGHQNFGRIHNYGYDLNNPCPPVYV